nr:DUF3265 domain-containing protein [uncultured Vibrio sp.]
MPVSTHIKYCSSVIRYLLHFYYVLVQVVKELDDSIGFTNLGT